MNSSEELGSQRFAGYLFKVWGPQSVISNKLKPVFILQDTEKNLSLSHWFSVLIFESLSNVWTPSIKLMLCKAIFNLQYVIQGLKV